MPAQATSGTATESRGFVRVRAIGEIDAYSAPAFERALSPQPGPPPAVLVVDLHEVTFLGVAGLLVLARTREWTHRAGTRLRMLSSNSPVDRAIALLDATPKVHNGQFGQSSRSKI
jgi:anti-anti-sigma factor